MDFFEHQDRARRKTGLLVVYFCAAVVLIIIAVYLAIAGILFYGQSRGGNGQPTTGKMGENMKAAGLDPAPGSADGMRPGAAPT